jgi:hypothetical protein
MNDDAAAVRKQLEVDRIRGELVDEFDDISPEMIEAGVRVEFERRSQYPIQDFVPIFVERTLRGKLRHPL